VSSEKATAIVLRVVEFSESSSVVTLMTREFGKIGALAKGARRLKGPFESALDLLAVCRIVFWPKSSAALDLVTEAKLERRFRPPRGDLRSLYAGYYVAELLRELTDEHDPQPPLFDLATGTLAALAEGADPIRYTLRFELMTLDILGHLPSFERCVGCGRAVAGGRRVAFGPLDGGVLCPGCRPGKKQVISVSAAVVRALEVFSARGGSAWQTDDSVRGCHGELRAVLNQYLNHLVGRRFRLHSYLTFGQGSPSCTSSDRRDPS